jgi:hypothetical protein
MAKAKRWSKTELNEMTETTDTKDATKLAIELGGAVLLLWAAKNVSTD